jgi:hypothetical protein
MVGLLFALPNTQLTRRLAKESRLYENHDVMAKDQTGDQCTLGINFEPKRPMRDILCDYKQVLEQVFEPAAYAGRLDRLAAMLDCDGRRDALPRGDARLHSTPLGSLHRALNGMPQESKLFWNTFINCARTNRAALPRITLLIAMYLHLGPFSRKVIAEIDRRIAEIDAAEQFAPLPAEIPSGGLDSWATGVSRAN